MPDLDIPVSGAAKEHVAVEWRPLHRIHRALQRQKIFQKKMIKHKNYENDVNHNLNFFNMKCLLLSTGLDCFMLRQKVEYASHLSPATGEASFSAAPERI